MVSNNCFISSKQDSLDFHDENIPIASFVSVFLFLIHDPPQNVKLGPRLRAGQLSRKSLDYEQLVKISTNDNNRLKKNKK